MSGWHNHRSASPHWSRKTTRLRNELHDCQRSLASQARVAELAKANDALKQSLDVLATEPALDKFLVPVLELYKRLEKVLADQAYKGELDSCLQAADECILEIAPPRQTKGFHIESWR